jgi:enoyl-CoA hydratase
MQQGYIRFSVVNNAGLVSLDRPQALNALNTQMVEALHAQMIAWRDDQNISHVVIASTSPRAFCAGGDIRQAYGHVTDGDAGAVAAFFAAEYRADAAVYEFPKPVIALSGGLMMGGGAGLAQCCSHVVVSETTRFAMPESAIGLFPDAGASLFLGRCPRPVALYLGMTGGMIGAADCLVLGLAHCMTNSTDMAALEMALLACHVDEIGATLDRFKSDPGPAVLPQHRATLAHIFGGNNAAVMRERAADLGTIKDDQFARDVHQALTSKCPMTMRVFMRLLDMADDGRDMGSALALDYHLAIKMAARPDFARGVRAVLIDKTNDPEWHPSLLENVSNSMLDEVFDHDGLPPLR